MHYGFSIMFLILFMGNNSLKVKVHKHTFWTSWINGLANTTPAILVKCGKEDKIKIHTNTQRMLHFSYSFSTFWYWTYRSTLKTIYSSSKMLTLLMNRPQQDKECWGWLIETQNISQNDLFDIPSRELLFVELIIHSCIHEKKYNKSIIPP